MYLSVLIFQPRRLGAVMRPACVFVALPVSGCATVATSNPGTTKPVKIRASTKQTAIIALLQRPEGASISEIVEATGWAVHSISGLISGGLKKKLGLPIASGRDATRGRVYRFTATG